MFIVALFTMVKRWKKPKCPLRDEQINKMWYTHTYNGLLLIFKKEGHVPQCE